MLTRSGTSPVEAFRSFRAAAASPLLGNPRAFTIEPLDGLRNILGLGLPSRGSTTTVPPTMYPKPRLEREPVRRQSLSYPAARPTGLGSGMPPMSVWSRPSLNRRRGRKGLQSGLRPQGHIRQAMSPLRRQCEYQWPYKACVYAQSFSL